MMQPILSTTPTKASVADKAGENKMSAMDKAGEKNLLGTDKTAEGKATDEAKNVEGKGEKASLDFAAVLDSVSSDEESVSNEELDGEDMLLEEATALDDSSTESVDDVNLLMKEGNSEDASEEGAEEEVEEGAEEGVEEGVESEALAQEKKINPLISHIESAQKTDAKLKEGAGNALVEESGIGVKDKGIKGLLKSSGKVSKDLKAETGLLGEGTEKEFMSKDAISAANKFDALMASNAPNNEINKSEIGQNVDSNMLQSLGTKSSNLDRPTQQTQAISPSLLQSNALQQPVELHAKNSAAVLGERIQMMLNQGKKEITIRLDPAELGSLQIKLHSHQDQLHVVIQTQATQSREIIEQNLPRLREQLSQEGINLGEASVEQQSQQSQQGQSSAQNSQQVASSTTGRLGVDDGIVGEPNEWIAPKIPLPAQGIDYYA